jgi:hypothetical protein
MDLLSGRGYFRRTDHDITLPLFSRLSSDDNLTWHTGCSLVHWLFSLYWYECWWNHWVQCFHLITMIACNASHVSCENVTNTWAAFHNWKNRNNSILRYCFKLDTDISRPYRIRIALWHAGAGTAQSSCSHWPSRHTNMPAFDSR